VSLRYQLDPAELFRDCVGEPDPWQVTALRSQHKRQLYLCSRQAGKSSVASIKGLHTAMYNPGSLVLMVSRSLPQAAELFRKALLAYRDLGRPLGTEYESRLHLELANGSRLVSLPGSDATVVGYSPAMILLDEAAETSSDLIEALMPSVAATRGAIIALTSAKAASGWFFELWSRPDRDLIWEAHTATANDSSLISDDFVHEQRITRGDRYVRREFYCQFGQDEGAWIEPEKIDRAFELVDTSQPLWKSPTLEREIA
jgi:Terminase large subunit, T4likevirus-type, N-terminal